MGFAERKELSIPADGTPLWRYYSTSNFIWLLQQSRLWFSRIDQFEDPFEGYGPLGNIKHAADRTKSLGSVLDTDTVVVTPDSTDAVLRDYEALRYHVYVNCWTMEPEESAAMWKSYVPNGDGIAIRTTFGKLRRAIERTSDIDFSASEVTYVDHLEAEIDTRNRLVHFTCKPIAYTFENELRLIINEIDDVDPHFESDSAPKFPYSQPGKEVDTDIDYLIDEIRISPFGPDWVDTAYWEDILERFGIHTTPQASRLSIDPEDAVKGDDSSTESS